jgi:predicted dehydrogenase
MKALRLGVIGVGSLGQHHARVYAGLPGVTLVGVADTDVHRARDIADKHRCFATTDFRDLIAQVEAVSVAVPTLLHHAITRDCLNAGIHVLVEKPMTVTLSDAEDLVRLADEKRLTLQVGHIERYNAALRACLGAVKAPVLIECRRWAPFTMRGADVDVVLDLMIHDLDIVLSLVNAPVRTVQASGITLLSNDTDVAEARLVFQNGCVASFSASRVAATKVRELRFYEPESVLVVDLLARIASIGRRAMGAAGSPELITEIIHGDGQEPLKLELQAFVDAVRTGTTPLVSGREGAAAQRLALTISDEIRRFRH